MTDKPKKPILSVQAQADEAVREARRGAALRANLHRRKAQNTERNEREDIEPAKAPAATTPAVTPGPSLLENEADAAVREARREAALRAHPLHRKD